MKNNLIYSFFSGIILLTSGCMQHKIPSFYVIDIQQGNDITQEMVNKLKPGMSKDKVTYIMGTPLIVDTFHPNRWDYVYSFKPGNGNRKQRLITLYFDEDKLSHVTGDIKTVSRQNLPQVKDNKERNVVVPLTERKIGLFQRLLNMIGLGSD